jgi:hypothetical protein
VLGDSGTREGCRRRAQNETTPVHAVGTFADGDLSWYKHLKSMDNPRSRNRRARAKIACTSMPSGGREKIDRGCSMTKWWRVEVRERVARQYPAKVTHVSRAAACTLALLGVVALGSCGSSSRGVIPTPDGGVRPVRSPYCDMFTTTNVLRTSSVTITLCSPDLPEGSPCGDGVGNSTVCTSQSDVTPELAEYFRDNRVPRLCTFPGRSGLRVCDGEPGQGCGMGSVCVPGLQRIGFGVCVPLPCNNN